MYGRGYFGSRWWRLPVSAPEGYTYIGPCRCGAGPHAFYQDESGRIVHARHLYRWGIPPVPTAKDLKDELEALKEEKAEIEKLIEKLEAQVKEKEEVKE